MTPDQFISQDQWSDLTQKQDMPEINFDRLKEYRLKRMKDAMKEHDVAMCVLVNPITLRYSVNYRAYGLFQSHIPTTYAFIPQEGPTCLFNAYDENTTADELRKGRDVTFFDAGPELSEGSRLLAQDIKDYMSEIGSDNRRIAVEYTNPSLTQALLQQGFEVIDGVHISEGARIIKSEDEINCIRWAVAVAQLGIDKMYEAMKPGVTELQLWGLLNYTNLANNGDWHEGRMLASGDRINPWIQEASPRKIEAGDLVGFDTDMVGPFGYFADVSRTFFCGPGKPSIRQKELYRLAVEEIDYNMKLIKPGRSFKEYQALTLDTDEQYHQNAYVCTVHGVGMCDEYPKIIPKFRGPVVYDGTFEAGMVLCVESYMGAVGERDGVKLEQQILLKEDGYELMSTYPLEECLLD